MKLPTLTQYMPEMFYFEDLDGDIVCTADSGLPLIRYDLKDRGGVLTLDHVQDLYRSHNMSLIEHLEKAAIKDTLWNLPLVYVYERSDFSVSFFAFQVYPVTIRKSLQSLPFEDILTGKFTMIVSFNENSEQVLEIHVEMKDKQSETPELLEKVVDIVMENLLAENSEYRKVYEEFGRERVIPQITFWPYEDPTHFRPGTKQKWVKK